jgi:hypothetical protein
MTTTDEVIAAMARQLADLTNAFIVIEGQRMQAQARASEGGGQQRRRIDARHVRVQEFAGKPEDWSDWAFALKRSIRAQSKTAFDLLAKVEQLSDDVDELDLTEEEDAVSGELYDILCQMCRGEALTVIRNVPECQGGRAWQKLFRKHNPKTVARMIKLLGEVTAPGKVADVREVESFLNKWEGRVAILEKEFQEVFTEAMRIAIVVHTMPIEIQEYIYANLPKDLTKDGSFKDVAYKIWVIAGNKAAMMKGGPVPTDIGFVSGEDDVKTDEQDEDEDVNAIGMNSQCFNCGGRGHGRRECPTPPKGYGKGAGEKSGGKGSGKDGQKGGWVKGRGGKAMHEYGKSAGKGMGYQGTCFNCGIVGHKKAECRKAPMRTNAIEEIQDDEVVDTGAVWWIGEVEAQTVKENEGYILMGKKGKKVKDVPVMLVEVGAEKLTRESAMKFNEASVRRPLASAVNVAKAGNRIIMEERGGYIENKITGERMKIRVEMNTYVYDVQMEDGSMVTVTLD